MLLKKYIEYIKDPLAEAKARVVIVSPDESWTALRCFYQELGCVELRMSDLVTEDAWLPMPDEIFNRVRDAMEAQSSCGKAVVLLGMPGYLALLTSENKQAAIIALREWMEGAFRQEAVCFLNSNDSVGLIIKEVFSNPRYRQGKQLIEIDAEQIEPKYSERRTEVMLVGDDLASFIPEGYDTFQKYLRYTEEHPDDNSARRIVVASEGRELAGLSAEVKQVVCLRDFARLFFAVEDEDLSEDALRWICEQGKESEDESLVEMLKKHFFPEGGIAKFVLNVFDDKKGFERETLLWVVKHLAPQGSYLECVLRQPGVITNNFRSAYITGAQEVLDASLAYAGERRVAIQNAGVSRSDADIRQFIARCKGESTSRVAPWLNCSTTTERAELLRRCSEEGIVSNAVKEVYPEVAMYLSRDPVFGDAILEEYFQEYRELKMTDRVTQAFCTKARETNPPETVQSRNSMVQRYTSDESCALLVVDAMGAEWLPMLVTVAGERNIGVEMVGVGRVHLPTSTIFNSIAWPDTARRLPDIKRFDNIAHNGAEAHEARSPKENLVAALNAVGEEVIPRVAEGLTRYERVLVTADHGSSRLAVLAWQAEPKLARTLYCEEGGKVSDWRYCSRLAQSSCPPELEESLNGEHWVVRGYDRLPKKGGGQGFELHGGATLEERLVPVVVFSRTGQFVPKTKTPGKRMQLIEKDDFDL